MRVEIVGMFRNGIAVDFAIENSLWRLKYRYKF